MLRSLAVFVLVLAGFHIGERVLTGLHAAHSGTASHQLPLAAPGPG